MLKGIFQDKEILIGDDTMIEVGEKWEERIDEALSFAQVAVLLVTKDFLASDYIMMKELPYILEAERRQNTKIAWIYWGYCNYEGTELAKYQALNDLSKPLGSLPKNIREAKLSEMVFHLSQIFR